MTTLEELAAVAGDDEMASYTLEDLKKIAVESSGLSEEIAVAEDNLKALKKELNSIIHNRLPEAMLGAGYDFGDKFETENWSFRLENSIVGAWPKTEDKRAAAEEELKRIGGEDLIHTTLQTKFIPSEGEILQEAGRALAAIDVPYEVSTTVNPSSLKKAARDKIKAGELVNCAKLGLYESPKVVLRKLK